MERRGDAAHRTMIGKFKATALLAIAALSLMSCTDVKKTPECSSKEVVGTVKDIALNTLMKSLENTYGYIPDRDGRKLLMRIKTETTPNVLSIRTTAVNKETGSRTCAASFNFDTSERVKDIVRTRGIFPVNTDAFSITFSVENVDGKDGFYVTVKGL